MGGGDPGGPRCLRGTASVHSRFEDKSLGALLRGGEKVKKGPSPSWAPPASPRWGRVPSPTIPACRRGGRKGDVAARLRQAYRTSPRSQVSIPYAVLPQHRGGSPSPARGPQTERCEPGHNSKASFSSTLPTVGREGERCAAVGRRRPRKSTPV
ncbi:hypothetical protein NDU88_003935 [Pleurodeles waltl]|uniref:Uncharacterized protein n=1 Tax=Pleurodeles waltl TaxID=8319 RepID=A0AAV7VII6_PLEWA|nr:hypothetical protein NDU88_003935 [Pleurodeles waltl]